jgi:hypothetical protein
MVPYQISQQIQAISTHSRDWLVMTENPQPGQSHLVQKNKAEYKAKMTWLDNIKHFFGYGPAGYYTLVNHIHNIASQSLQAQVANIHLFNQSVDSLYKGLRPLSEGNTARKVAKILDWESKQLNKLEKKFLKNTGLVSRIFFKIFSFVKNMPNQLAVMCHLKSEIVRPNLNKIFYSQLDAHFPEKEGLSKAALILRQDSAGKTMALTLIEGKQIVVFIDPSQVTYNKKTGRAEGPVLQISIESIHNQRVLNIYCEEKYMKLWKGFIANLCHLEKIHDVRNMFAPFEQTEKPSNLDNPVRIKDVREYSTPYKQDLEKYKQIEDNISAPASFCKIENLVVAAHASF